MSSQGTTSAGDTNLDRFRSAARADDRSLPLDERLEAFEDVIDSEVGDTALTRSRNLERRSGFRQLFLKFEGANPTGTHKDRIAFAQVLDAMRRGYDTLSVATCGNYGAALSFAAGIAGLRCLVHIPKGYEGKRIDGIKGEHVQIVWVPGDYEHAIDVARARAAEDELYDANPGGANVRIQLKAYAQIADEIYDDLRDAPAVVAVPVSNGTVLAGVYKGFLSLYRRGKTSRMPRFVAGSSYRKNPIVAAVLAQREECDDLRPESIHETPTNEPLVNWHSIDGSHALQAIRQTGGWASYSTDKEMQTLARLLRQEEGLSVLPAATAGLAALLGRQRTSPLPGDRYVALLTARKG